VQRCGHVSSWQAFTSLDADRCIEVLLRVALRFEVLF
jgi:hypothetical protein